MFGRDGLRLVAGIVLWFQSAHSMGNDGLVCVALGGWGNTKAVPNGTAFDVCDAAETSRVRIPSASS